jgi:hypothetical protein
MGLMALIIVLLSVHVLTGVFWAGSTFTLALGGAQMGPLFRAQMGAATVNVLAGIGLWAVLHRGPPAGMEWTLAAGALAAVIAAGVQGALHRSKPLLAQQIAAVLLAVTVLCMTLARYTP